VGAVWVLLAPLACCAGPLLVAGFGVAGALAWGGLGLVAAAAVAAVAVIIRSRWRRFRYSGGHAAPMNYARAAGGPRRAVKPVVPWRCHH
jgi:hypothetical protein